MFAAGGVLAHFLAGAGEANYKIKLKNRLLDLNKLRAGNSARVMRIMKMIVDVDVDWIAHNDRHEKQGILHKMKKQERLKG